LWWGVEKLTRSIDLKKQDGHSSLHDMLFEEKNTDSGCPLGLPVMVVSCPCQSGQNIDFLTSKHISMTISTVFRRWRKKNRNKEAYQVSYCMEYYSPPADLAVEGSLSNSTEGKQR
jgi:hypothetical protein